MVGSGRGFSEGLGRGLSWVLLGAVAVEEGDLDSLGAGLGVVFQKDMTT
jgi:hypothetical protein